MNMDYFNYCQGLTMTNDRFDRLFGGPRPARRPMEQRHMDSGRQHPEGDRRSGAAHGPRCASANGRKNTRAGRRGGAQLRGQRSSPAGRPFDNIWIQPAAGDAGGALGRPCSSGTNSWEAPPDHLRPAGPPGRLLSGTGLSEEQIRDFLEKKGITAREVPGKSSHGRWPG